MGFLEMCTDRLERNKVSYTARACIDIRLPFDYCYIAIYGCALNFYVIIIITTTGVLSRSGTCQIYLYPNIINKIITT